MTFYTVSVLKFIKFNFFSVSVQYNSYITLSSNQLWLTVQSMIMGHEIHTSLRLITYS